jgi:hypothetical protein
VIAVVVVITLNDADYRAVTAIGYHAYPTTPPYQFTKDPESLKQVMCDVILMCNVCFT